MVIISAGHYPAAPGGGGSKALGINEHSECKIIVDYLESYLKNYSIDYYRLNAKPLYKKIKEIRKVDRIIRIRLSLEVHLNNSESGQAKDYACGLYYSETGGECASEFIEGFKKDIPVRESLCWIPEKKKAFLEDVRPVSVILEPLFGVNPSHAGYLKMSRGKEFIARSIFNSLLRIFDKNII